MQLFLYQVATIRRARRRAALASTLFACAALGIAPAFAQAPLPRPIAPPQAVQAPAPVYPAAELDRIVSPIALYPDPLLAQVLAAATFPMDIPEAARWADEHHALTGAQLTAAITADRLPWDPSVQALLPFPSVLDMMASAMPWTEEIGAAFLAQRMEVMDAVQRMRQKAQRDGYLRSNPEVTVSQGPDVEIQPVDPGYIVVPCYDPYILLGPPPPGIVIGGAIGFGFGVRIGTWFGPWGWGSTRFIWSNHALIVNNSPWGHEWGNRGNYVHPYPDVPHHVGPRLPDQHPPTPRTPTERVAPRTGHMPTETHRGGGSSGGRAGGGGGGRRGR
jgi:hypothetical protein